MSDSTIPHLREARCTDIFSIKKLIDVYAGEIMLEKNLVTLFESVQQFVVAEIDGEIVGCGALHVFWDDLAEIRSVAVNPHFQKFGIGHSLVRHLIHNARLLEVKRIFVLTFETRFFGRHGFTEIEGTPVSHEIFEELLRSYDQGVAEFLDLSYVKPNTLGNTRMLLHLTTPEVPPTAR